VIEAGDSIRAAIGSDSGYVGISYSRLASYRRRLSRDVNQIVRSAEVRGPLQLGARLKHLKVTPSEAGE
jgi:hypothetical protein